MYNEINFLENLAETVGGFLGYETNFLHAMAQLKSFHKISNGRAYLYGTPFQGKQKKKCVQF